MTDLVGGGYGGDAEVGEGAAEVLVRVYRRVVDADFVVDVVAGGAAGVSDVADDLAAHDRLAGGNGESAHVAVAGFDAVAVIDTHHAAIAVFEAGRDDDAVGGGADGSSKWAGDVDAGVELAFTSTEDGVFT